MKKLNLPEYEERDEQPQLNMDSRVVRMRKPSHSTSSDSNDSNSNSGSTSSRTSSSSLLNNNTNTSSEDDNYADEKFVSSSSNDESIRQKQKENQQKLSNSLSQELTHQQQQQEQQPEHLLSISPSRQQSVVSRLSGLSRATTMNSRLTRRKTRRTDSGSIDDNNSLNKVPSRKIRSPKGVFPVFGMGEPLKKEKTIASAYLHHDDDDGEDDDDEEYDEIANPYHQRNISDILNEHNSSGIQRQTSSISSDSSSAPVASVPQEFNPAPPSTTGYNNDNHDPATNNFNDGPDDLDDYDEEMDPIQSIYTTTSTGERRKKKFVDNPYNPDDETMGGMLKQVLTRVKTRAPTISSNHTNNNNAIPDIERGEGGMDPSTSNNKSAKHANDSALSRVISHVITRVVSNPSLYNVDPSVDNPRSNQKMNTTGLSRQMTKTNYTGGHGRQDTNLNPVKRSKTVSVNDKTLVGAKPNSNNHKGSFVEAALNQFSFSGGHNSDDIHKKLTEARITPKAAALANDVAGIYNDSVHVHVHEADKRRKKLLLKKLKRKRNKNNNSINNNNIINNSGSGTGSGRKISYARSDSIRSNANMNNTSGFLNARNNSNNNTTNNNTNANNNSSVHNINRSSIFNEDDVLSLDSYDSNCSPINYDFLNADEGNSNDHDNQTTVAGPEITQPDKTQDNTDDKSDDVTPQQSQSQAQSEKDTL
ncbi:unnamed protein product [[Candida] boidinii]|uniref:Unnamed protein product n=1 Tax=Candida boidinii TaxID=5477 RepID=A0A9W6WF84_CANBO|nr:unnamed protein product [[Candida] boidinii]